MTFKPEMLRAILDNGESVEWAAQPEPFKSIDRHNKASFITRCIITIVIAAALIAVYLIMINGKEIAVSKALLIVIAAVAVFICLRPLMDARALKNKRAFIVTDKHLITYESETNHRKMLLSDIDAALIIDKGNGIGDIIFGTDAIKRPYSKIYLTTLIPRESADSDAKITGMAF